MDYMKYSGCKIEHERERINALLRAYRREVSQCRVIESDRIWEKIVNSPCERFWVSDNRAAIVIASMLKGDRLTGMRPTKRRMYEEIYRRTLEKMALAPDRPLLHIVGEVVEERAPQFYLTAVSARIMYYNELRRCRRSRKA